MYTHSEGKVTGPANGETTHTNERLCLQVTRLLPTIVVKGTIELGCASCVGFLRFIASCT